MNAGLKPVTDQWLLERIAYFEKMTGRNRMGVNSSKFNTFRQTLAALQELQSCRAKEGRKP